MLFSWRFQRFIFSFLGGTLRIYADSLKPNIPYKTILLSTTDMADFAVAEALEKYGLEKENPRDYCIAQVLYESLILWPLP